jgi:DeoR family fructose operon transcriptional repressor
MGVNGIHFQFGYTTPDQEEALVKEKALSLSREVFVLADETKFTEISFAKIADLDSAIIITNEIDPDLMAQYRDKTTIKVVTA